MPETPCLGCGQMEPLVDGRRCARCAPVRERARHNRAYDTAAWKRASRDAIDEHVKVFGWVCPGYARPAHPSRDLTAGHPIALANGGAAIQSDLIVECRSCGSRRGARDVA